MWPAGYRRWAIPYSQSQQLLTKGQIFKEEVLQGPESADHPPEEMPERPEHGKKVIGEPESSIAPSHSFCGYTAIWRGTALESFVMYAFPGFAQAKENPFIGLLRRTN